MQSLGPANQLGLTLTAAVGAAFLLARLARSRICWQRLPPAPLPRDFGVTAYDVASAARRIAPWVRRTPVVRSEALDALTERRVAFKCELFQKTGSFKIRGATNAALLARKNTLVTHSSGNHASALALAARNVGGRAFIVMPRTASATKRKAVEGYGATIELCEPTNAARATAAEALRKRVDGHFVHPSNDLDVIAGQGTVALELLADAPDLDVLVVPVGGGGLVGGIAVYAKSRKPNICVVAAEPRLVDDAAKSKAAGNLVVHHDRPNAQTTIADGLKTVLGSNTWPVVRDLVDAVLTVDEAQIASATRLTWETLKLCIEPSAGVGVAVLLSDEFKSRFPPTHYPNVGVVLCGGNVDLVRHVSADGAFSVTDDHAAGQGRHFPAARDLDDPSSSSILGCCLGGGSDEGVRILLGHCGRRGRWRGVEDVDGSVRRPRRAVHLGQRAVELGRSGHGPNLRTSMARATKCRANNSGAPGPKVVAWRGCRVRRSVSR